MVPCKSATKSCRSAIQFSAKVCKFSLAALEQSAGLSVRAVVMIDEGRQLCQLILKQREVGCRRHRVLIAPRMPAQGCEDLWVVAIDTIAGHTGETAQLGYGQARGGIIRFSFLLEDFECTREPLGGCRTSIGMNGGHDINLSWAKSRSS